MNSERDCKRRALIAYNPVGLEVSNPVRQLPMPLGFVDTETIYEKQRKPKKGQQFDGRVIEFV